MLTRRQPSTRDDQRRRPRVAAVVPTARVAHVGLVALTVGLAAVPALVTLAVGGDGYFAPLVLLGLGTGAAVGWAVDDPAAELLASTPVGGPARLLIRVGAAALVAASGLVVLLVVLAVGPGLPPGAGDRVPEAAAAGAVSLAVGVIAARRGERAAGAAAVAAGVFGPAFVASLSVKIEEIPSFLAGPHHGRWWLVAVAASVVALHAGRDPARR